MSELIVFTFFLVSVLSFLFKLMFLLVIVCFCRIIWASFFHPSLNNECPGSFFFFFFNVRFKEQSIKSVPPSTVIGSNEVQLEQSGHNSWLGLKSRPKASL